METLKESTSVYDNESEPPRSRSNRTESIPLKGSVSPDDDALLRVIIGSFIALSAAVTIALATQIYIGVYQVVPHGSVATDSLHCSTIGTNILKKGGNAVDAAVAAVLCLGVVNPHITGLGGGGFMLVYNHRARNVLEALDFRETAPASAELGIPRGTKLGVRTVGIPGLLRGLGQAHSRHGKLSWKEVVEPAVNLARQGFPAPKSLVAARKLLPQTSLPGPISPLQNLLQSLEPGQTLKMPELADSLETIAVGGPDELYTGNISKVLLSAVGGMFSETELRDYKPTDREPLLGTLGGFDIIVPGAPSGGPLLLASLHGAATSNMNSTQDRDAVLNVAQVAREALTAFYAENGDPNFAVDSSPLLNGPQSWNYPETTGSAVSVIDPNDLYVSVVTTINSPLGSQILTKGGFLLNNALVSFDWPSAAAIAAAAAATAATTTVPSGPGADRSPQLPRTRLARAIAVWGSHAVANNPAPGKRPISLLTPAIAVESGKVCGRRLVLGGSDPVTVGQVLWRLLVFSSDVSSVDEPRARMSSTGDITLERPTGGYAVAASVNVVEKVSDTLMSHSDIRGGGIPSRF